MDIYKVYVDPFEAGPVVRVMVNDGEHQEMVGLWDEAECEICGPVEAGNADPIFHPEVYADG